MMGHHLWVTSPSSDTPAAYVRGFQSEAIPAWSDPQTHTFPRISLFWLLTMFKWYCLEETHHLSQPPLLFLSSSRSLSTYARGTSFYSPALLGRRKLKWSLGSWEIIRRVLSSLKNIYGYVRM
jgi:hypothetical protein